MNPANSFICALSLPMGMFCTQFADTKFQLEKDDILVAYTDGITEAANASSELWAGKTGATAAGFAAGLRQSIVEGLLPQCPSSQMASHSEMM